MCTRRNYSTCATVDPAMMPTMPAQQVTTPNSTEMLKTAGNMKERKRKKRWIRSNRSSNALSNFILGNIIDTIDNTVCVRHQLWCPPTCRPNAKHNASESGSG